ncbi:helix-turn-helix domain-containing protein [Maridesulfovibrio salexigens]|uniref:Transcriptional regulator, XRE family n=1 Tax=Maridesulfovibrio salexigens (strain ATCC 14822 / DSM 2638 / NCIMB 8403 / VKM B-1763) TaxID=526222 RepID=C6BRP3_MARSD|nr:helix-turn-helix transcriptional regulator [Maridesulfovibrio salexigens]ACS79483.1 transcriptional regulator, XRE family [Maridesulfovibrio salexigens DSM 2638]
MAEISKLVGNKIRSIRKKRGLTQAQLGNESDLNDKYISEIERGSSKLTVDALNKIANGLKVPVKDILDFDTAQPTREELEKDLLWMIQKTSDEQIVFLHKLVSEILK